MSKLFYNRDNIVTSPTTASAILSNEEYSNLTVEEYELRLSIESDINKLNYYNDQLEASIEEYEAVSHASGLSTEAFLETAKSASRRLGIPIDTVNISSEGLIQGIISVITGVIKVIWKVITAIWDQLLKILGIRSNKVESNIEQSNEYQQAVSNAKPGVEVRKLGVIATEKRVIDKTGDDDVVVVSSRGHSLAKDMSQARKLSELEDKLSKATKALEETTTKINKDKVRGQIDKLRELYPTLRNISESSFRKAVPALVLFGNRSTYLLDSKNLKKITDGIHKYYDKLSIALVASSSLTTQGIVDRDIANRLSSLNGPAVYLSEIIKPNILFNIYDPYGRIANSYRPNPSELVMANIKPSLDPFFNDGVVGTFFEVEPRFTGDKHWGDGSSYEHKYDIKVKSDELKKWVDEFLNLDFNAYETYKDSLKTTITILNSDAKGLRRAMENVKKDVDSFVSKSNKTDGAGSTALRGLATYLSMASSTLTFLVSGVDGISAFATKLSEVHRDYNKLQLDLLSI